MPQKRVPYIPAGSSEWQEKFINCMMRRGKKSLARRLFQESLQTIKEKGQQNPEAVFEKAIRNVMPHTEVRARRIGGSVYQIPVEVTPRRQLSLSMRWIIGACRSRKGSAMSAKLSQELMDAANETGAAIKKKEDVHRMAMANKAFAHLARYGGK